MSLNQRPVALFDVAYDDANASAKAAVVTAASFDAVVGDDVVVDVHNVAAYVPGVFYQRELPCLLTALAQLTLTADHVLVVDGYVVLDDAGRKGLGMHLHEATGHAVVGVAKTSFKGSAHGEWRSARAVVRGQNATRPLYVTAVGVDVDDAAAAVKGMAGKDRLPTLILRADQLARGHLAPRRLAV